MKKIFLLISLFVFMLSCSTVFAAADETAAAAATVAVDELPQEMGQIEKELNKIEKDIQSHKLSGQDTQSYIKTLSGLHGVITAIKVRGSEELASLQKKITALAAVTAEGETEPAEIAKQRQEFTKQADEIKSRIASADLALGQIDEINTAIMKLRNQKLLEQITVKNDSILSFQNLIKSMVSFGSFVYDVCLYPAKWYGELSAEQRQDVLKKLLQMSLVGIISIFLAGFSSLFIRKKWGYKDDIEKPDYMQKVCAACVTLLARGIMPSVLAGAFWLWVRAHQAIFSGAFGLTLRLTALYLLYLFLSSAIVLVLFTPKRPNWRLIEVNDEKAKSLSFALIFSIIIICVFSFFQILAIRLEYSDDIVFSLKLLSNTVKAFCILLIVNRALYNNKALTEEELKQSLEGSSDEEGIQGLSLSSKISLLISVATIITFSFSLFGYILLSEYIFNRFIASVLIVGVFYILHKAILVLFRQFISLKIWLKDFRITKKQTEKAEFWFSFFLTPVLFCVCTLILLAVWGVSVDILLQNVKKFLMGFDIGGMHVSIVSIFLGIIFFFISLLITQRIKNSLLTGKLSKIDMDIGVRNSLAAGIGFIGIIISCLIGISVMGGSLKGLALMAGALSIGAGLGLQNIVNNFVSGFILLFERPIKIGDWVVINDYEGIVKQINIRSTVIETFNKSDVIIPNATILSNNLVNMTYKNKSARIDIFIGVGYESDVDKVKEVLVDLAKHTKGVLANPEPFVAFLDFADSSLNYRLSFYLSDVFQKTTVSNAIREGIVKRFREENINIPFPQRVVYLHTEDSPVEVKLNAAPKDSDKK